MFGPPQPFIHATNPFLPSERPIQKGSELTIRGRKFRVIELLGEGSFGSVWRVIPFDGQSTLTLALKETISDNEANFAQCMAEATILQKIHSASPSGYPYIPKYVTHESQRLDISRWRVRTLMTLVEGSCLDRWLLQRTTACVQAAKHQPSGSGLSPTAFITACQETWKFLRDLAGTLSVVEKVAVHRDVNSHNIMVTGSCLNATSRASSRLPSVQEENEVTNLFHRVPSSCDPVCKCPRKYSLIDFGLSVNLDYWRGGGWESLPLAGDCKYWPPCAWKLFVQGPVCMENEPWLRRQYRDRIDNFGLAATGMEFLFAIASQQQLVETLIVDGLKRGDIRPVTAPSYSGNSDKAIDRRPSTTPSPVAKPAVRSSPSSSNTASPAGTPTLESTSVKSLTKPLVPKLADQRTSTGGTSRRSSAGGSASTVGRVSARPPVDYIASPAEKNSMPIETIAPIASLSASCSPLLAALATAWRQYWGATSSCWELFYRTFKNKGDWEGLRKFIVQQKTYEQIEIKLQTLQRELTAVAEWFEKAEPGNFSAPKNFKNVAETLKIIRDMFTAVGDPGSDFKSIFGRLVASPPEDQIETRSIPASEQPSPIVSSMPRSSTAPSQTPFRILPASPGMPGRTLAPPSVFADFKTPLIQTRNLPFSMSPQIASRSPMVGYRAPNFLHSGHNRQEPRLPFSTAPNLMNAPALQPATPLTGYQTIGISRQPAFQGAPLFPIQPHPAPRFEQFNFFPQQFVVPHSHQTTSNQYGNPFAMTISHFSSSHT